MKKKSKIIIVLVAVIIVAAVAVVAIMRVTSSSETETETTTVENYDDEVETLPETAENETEEEDAEEDEDTDDSDGEEDGATLSASDLPLTVNQVMTALEERYGSDYEVNSTVEEDGINYFAVYKDDEKYASVAVDLSTGEATETIVTTNEKTEFSLV